MTTKSYKTELRERIVLARADGYSSAEVSKLFRVSKRSVERYWRSYVESGSVLPKQRGGYRRSRLEAHDDTLRRWISEEPDLTLEEIRQRCLDELSVQIGTTALWQRLDHLGLSLKKNAARRRAESA